MSQLTGSLTRSDMRMSVPCSVARRRLGCPTSCRTAVIETSRRARGPPASPGQTPGRGLGSSDRARTAPIRSLRSSRRGRCRPVGPSPPGRMGPLEIRAPTFPRATGSDFVGNFQHECNPQWILTPSGYPAPSLRTHQTPSPTPWAPLDDRDGAKSVSPRWVLCDFFSPL